MTPIVVLHVVYSTFVYAIDSRRTKYCNSLNTSPPPPTINVEALLPDLLRDSNLNGIPDGTVNIDSGVRGERADYKHVWDLVAIFCPSPVLCNMMQETMNQTIREPHMIIHHLLLR